MLGGKPHLAICALKEAFEEEQRTDMPAEQDPGAEIPDHLRRRAEAETRVANAARAVVRQRKIVATLQRRNFNSRDAESRLAQLEQNPFQFEQQVASIINEQKNQ